MKKISKLLFIITLLSSVLFPLQSKAAVSWTTNIIADLNKSTVLTGEKISLYVSLPDTVTPVYYDVKLEGPTGNSYTGVSGTGILQKDQMGKWLIDIPIPYNAQEGNYYVKNIDITVDNGDNYTLVNEQQQNPQLQFIVSQSNRGLPVNVSIPFASNSLVVEGIIFNTLNPQKMEDTMSVNPGQNVPEGIYNIQIKAHDDKNSYILFKRNYVFNGTTNNITFSNEEVSHLLINMQDSNLQLSGLILQPKNWRSFNMTALYNNSNSVYISKMEYESLWSMFRTNDQFKLDYMTHNINGYEDINLKFNTNLRADIIFEKPSYKPSEIINNFPNLLQLKDDFDNTILFATNSSYKHVNGSIKFSHGTESFLVPVNNNLAYPEITLPSAPGTYNVTYENIELPFNVESRQVTINIAENPTNDTDPNPPAVTPVTDTDGVIKGTAEAGATITVKVGDSEIGSAVVQADGSFNVPISPQPVGTVLSLTATDNAGNVSEVKNTKVIRHNIPEITDGIYFEKVPTWIGYNMIIKDNELPDFANEYEYAIDPSFSIPLNVSENGLPSDILERLSDPEYVPYYQKDRPTGSSFMEYGRYYVLVILFDSNKNAIGYFEKSMDIGVPIPKVFDITDKSTEINGQSMSGFTIRVEKDGVLLGTTTVSDYNTFTIQIPPQQGGTKLSITATDTSGNVSESTTLNVIDTTTPPLTSIILDSSKPKNRDWYSSDVNVTLNTNDDGPGIDKTFYRINNGEWIQYNNSFEIQNEGVTTINYKSIDKAGNEESPKSETVKIDRSKPETTINELPRDWTNQNVEVTLTGTDQVSGVASTQYKINGGDWVTYQGPFTINQEGVNIIEFKSVDNAGNSEGVKSATIKVDHTAPVTSISPAKDGWYNSDVKLNLTSLDNLSGVNKTQYRINGENWVEYDNGITLISEGINKVEYRSIDKSANIEDAKVVEVKIDKTTPTLDFTFNQSVITDKNHKMIPISVTFNTSDSISGIAFFELVSVVSNQSDNGSGDGNTNQDIQGVEKGTADTSFLLRAETSGSQDRIYTVTYKAYDNAGNFTVVSKSIIVKSNNSKK